MLYLSAVNSKTLELLKTILSIDEFSELRLVGGTSLALQIGHRKSVDLDFFGSIEFEELNLQKLFSRFNKIEVIKRSRNINIFEIDGVKVDFVNYSYPWLQEPLVLDKIRLAKTKDIAAMKLAAITGRGSKKDFIDLYFLLKEFSLEEIIGFYTSKYDDASTYLALKSLCYFADADQGLPLDMLINVSWEDVKKIISIKAINYIKRI